MPSSATARHGNRSWLDLQHSRSVDNLFDATFWNPTATSVRNLTVYGLGRTVTVGYRRTF